VASIDLKKVYKEHYSGKPGVMSAVEIPARPYLMIDGSGDPNTSEEYRQAVSTLYPLAYGLRAEIKKASGDGYTVLPLEGLWWVPDMRDFSVDDKSNWLWTAMICLPEVFDLERSAEIIAQVAVDKKLEFGGRARVAEFEEGLAAQVMYLGPYADEGPTIAALHDFIAEQGKALVGKHHEIYLSDPRKTDPAKLKTIIRQPMG